MLKTSLVYREQIPSCAALDAVWTLNVKHDLLGSLPYLTLPDGCVDLIYRLKRDTEGKIDGAALLIAGPTDRPATFFPTAGEEFIGVRFAPGWGGLALGISPVELVRTFTGAGGLTPRLSRLEKSLFACTSQQQAVAVLRETLEDWTDKIAHKPSTLHAVQMLRVCGGQVRVDHAARHLGVSARTFRRNVKELAGLSPKSLTRIFRFRRALEKMNEWKGLSLCDVALEAGYTDQAHMSHEFQMLGGFAPRSPAKLAGGAPFKAAN